MLLAYLVGAGKMCKAEIVAAGIFVALDEEQGNAPQSAASITPNFENNEKPKQNTQRRENSSYG